MIFNKLLSAIKTRWIEKCRVYVYQQQEARKPRIIESMIIGFFRAYIEWWNKQHERELELRKHRPRNLLPSRLDGSQLPKSWCWWRRRRRKLPKWRWSNIDGIFSLLSSTIHNFLFDLWNSNHLSCFYDINGIGIYIIKRSNYFFISSLYLYSILHLIAFYSFFIIYC